MATKYFTPEFRADANYTIDMNHPEDDTLGGSTETFRSDEWQLEQISVGGDIRIDNVRGRFLYYERIVRHDHPAQRWQPEPRAVGSRRTLTSTFRKGGAAITGMCSTASMSTPVSLFLTSACSATTTSITGLISLRSYPRIRRGSSTACASSGSPPPS